MSKFLDKSFLVDYRINKEIENYFKNNNINYIKTKKHTDLYEEIDGHPDIIACDLGDITVIEPKTYEKLESSLKNYNVLKGKTYLDEKYPKDIAYNVVFTNKYLIGNLEYTDDIIKEYAKDRNLEFINVKQGYTRCSTIPLSNDVFITSDKNIYHTLKSKNIYVYYLDIENIMLSNRYNGFLGGSCGVYDDEIIFFGSILKSNVYDNFDKIAKKHNIKYTNIFDSNLIDFGSMIGLYKI